MTSINQRLRCETSATIADQLQDKTSPRLQHNKKKKTKISSHLWATRTYYHEICEQHTAAMGDRISAAKNAPIRVDWSRISFSRYLWITYNVYTVLREIIICYSLKSGDRSFFSFDLAAAELDRSTHFDGLLYLTFGAMNSFNSFVLFALVSSMLDRFLVSHLAEIVVDTWRQFFAQNPELRLRFTPFGLTQNARQLATLFAALRSSSTVQVSCDKMRSTAKSHLRLLSEMDRKKILRIALIDEMARLNIFVSNALFLIMGTAHYMLTCYIRYSILGNFHMLLCFLVQFSYLFDFVKRGFFFVFTVQTICSVYLLLFREVHRRIVREIALVRHNHRNLIGQLGPRKIEETFRRIERLRSYHNELTQYIVYANSRFIAPIMFVFTITSLPSNIYLLTYSMVNRIDLINRLFVSTLFVLPWVGLGITLTPIARLNRSIYSFSTLLVPLMAELCIPQAYHIPLIRQKLKLAAFYEHSLPAANPHAFLGLTFPPVGALYPETIFRGIAFYISYILFMLNLLQN